MADAVFVQEGNALDYLATADVVAGEVVVQGDLIGITTRDIPAGRSGAIVVEGVFDLVKQAGLAITAGQVVYWDVPNRQTLVSAPGNVLLGKAVRAAAAGDATVRVRLIPCAFPLNTVPPFG